MNAAHVSAGDLVDYLHGELPAERDAVVAVHLAQCRECAEARDVEASMTEMVRAIGRAQERALPPGVTTSIRAAAESRRGSARRSSSFPRWVIAIPLAAAAALIVWLGIRSVAVNRQRTTIAAGYFVNRHAMYSAVTPFADDAPIPPVFASDNAQR